MNARKRRTWWISGLVLALGWAGSPSVGGAGTRITAIDFHGTEDPQTLEISADGPLSVEKQENVTDHQVILEFRNATISPQAARKIDTSSFNSKVLLVSPYRPAGQSNVVRVVVQMRGPTDSAFDIRGGKAILSVRGDVGASAENAAAPSALEPPASATAAATLEPAPSTETPAPTMGGEASVAQAPAESAPPSTEVSESGASSDVLQSRQARQIESPLQSTGDAGLSPKARAEARRVQEFLNNRERRTFIGKPITIQVRDMDVVDVFRVIAEASGFNIILGDDVNGKLTLSLIDVPWDQALSVVMQQMGLAAERSNNILRVMTLESLKAEKTLEFQAKMASQVAAPRITRIFPISYAELGDLATLLGRFQSTSIVSIDSGSATGQAAVAAAQSGAASGGGEGGGGKGGGHGAIILSDKRTNSLIIRDTVESMDRIQKLIELLDTQTPQIQIEGKVVEASESFTRGTNGSFAFGVNGPNPVFGSLMGGSDSQQLLSNLSTASSQGGAFSMAFLPSLRTVNASLAIAESESKVKLLSSPKLVVLNKQTATITQTTPIAIPVTTTSNGATSVTINVLSATLALSVTPSITNDGGVLMTLTLSRDVPSDAGGGQTAVATRNITTQVVVDSGTTLVLGGIYTGQTTLGESGLPFLRKIPVLGALFGRESENVVRSELFFFVSPQIINPKRSGLAS